MPDYEIVEKLKSYNQTNIGLKLRYATMPNNVSSETVIIRLI